MLKHDATDTAIRDLDNLAYVEERLRSALRAYKQRDALSDVVGARQAALELRDCVGLIVSEVCTLVDRELASRVLADMKASPAPCDSGVRGAG